MGICHAKQIAVEAELIAQEKIETVIPSLYINDIEILTYGYYRNAHTNNISTEYPQDLMHLITKYYFIPVIDKWAVWWMHETPYMEQDDYDHNSIEFYHHNLLPHLECQRCGYLVLLKRANLDQIYCDTIQKFLVLNVTHTLVSTKYNGANKLNIKSDIFFQVNTDGAITNFYVDKRPFLEEFLQRMCRYYEIIVASVQNKEFINALLDKIDPNNEYISHVLYIDSHSIKENKYILDLSKFKRKCKDIIFISAEAHKYMGSPKNAIPIPGYFGDQKDKCLLKICNVLETTLYTAPDVRTILNANKFSFEHICQQ
eukprot:535426_1